MSFDKDLPLKERLHKRRKLRKIRYYLFLAIMVSASLIYLFYSSSTWFQSKKDQNLRQDKLKDDSRIIEIKDDVIPLSDGKENTLVTEDSSSGTPVDKIEEISTLLKENSQNNENIGQNDIIDTMKTEDYIAGDVTEKRVLAETTLDYNILKSELEAYISKFNGRYGIYYFDLVHNDDFGINEKEEYTAASTYKVPLNLYVYKGIKESKINAEGTLKYIEADYEGGAGIIQNANYGTKYTVRKLCWYSLVYSDNVASRMLMRFVGRTNVKKFMREMGGTVVSDTKNISCPKDMGLYLKKVYEFCNSNGELGEELMDNMIKTDFHDRLPLLLPENIKIAHKTGNLIGIVHDVGIVFEDKPYILAVMSKDVISDGEANTVISNVSKKVYDFVKDR